jgi:hypothetical protein
MRAMVHSLNGYSCGWLAVGGEFNVQSMTEGNIAKTPEEWKETSLGN